MCRLYVAVNDDKGNKIHRHGSNNWDNDNREFIKGKWCVKVDRVTTPLQIGWC